MINRMCCRILCIANWHLLLHFLLEKILCSEEEKKYLIPNLNRKMKWRFDYNARVLQKKKWTERVEISIDWLISPIETFLLVHIVDKILKWCLSYGECVCSGCEKMATCWFHKYLLSQNNTKRWKPAFSTPNHRLRHVQIYENWFLKIGVIPRVV